MKKLILASIALVSFATAANAQAQNSSATQTTNLNLNDAIEITFVATGNATGNTASMDFNSISAYQYGVSSTDQQLRVRSNKNFAVTVKSNATNFTYSGSTTPAPVMPVNNVLDVLMLINGTGGAIANSGQVKLSTTAANLLTNCTKGGNQTFSVAYLARPGFAYPAGTYTVDVVYTATQL